MIALFFVDFKRLVKSDKFGGENMHPTLYFEDDATITFYKPAGSFIYHSTIFKNDKPEDMDINALKSEFNAVEIPVRLNSHSRIDISGILS